MTVITRSIHISTQGNCDIVDITGYIDDELSRAEVLNGTVTVFISGSTAGLSTVEYENGLVSDLKSMWERIVPQNIPYQHDLRWGDGNGHSHVRATTLGPSLVVPFVNKRMTLGTWQQIIVIDFDNRPRTREIILQIMGD